VAPPLSLLLLLLLLLLLRILLYVIRAHSGGVADQPRDARSKRPSIPLEQRARLPEDTDVAPGIPVMTSRCWGTASGHLSRTS